MGIKRKSTGYIYLPGSQYCESGGYLKPRSWLHDTSINSAQGLEKYINKYKLYRKCSSRRLKDTNMSEIENSLNVINVMIVTPILNIKRELWGACSILRKVNDGL